MKMNFKTTVTLLTKQGYRQKQNSKVKKELKELDDVSEIY